MNDSIDAELLDYYQRELSWLRHAGSDFAARYPKVARRLELSPGECPDPHVERLLEGFALLAARLQRRLDDGYAEFSDALLEQLYPLALRPLPSCAIVRFEPDPEQGDLAAGYLLPRGTPLFVTTTRGETIHFRSTADVTLWPLAIEDAVLLDGDEAQAVTGDPTARSALRLGLRLLGKAHWDELPIERLRIHLAASPPVNAALYDLLGAHAFRVFSGAPGETPQPCNGRSGLPGIAGFADREALLPDEDGVHPGLRLLAEYFAFPEKFAFFDLPFRSADGAGDKDHLDDVNDGNDVDGMRFLYILFDRPPAIRLHLQPGDIALGCAPAINLFPRTSEPLRPDGTRSEYRLVADAHRENSVEIHSIRALRAATPQGAREIPHYYGCRHAPDVERPEGMFWHARRIAGQTPNRRGTDLMLSLVDTGFAPLEETPDYSLTAELLCTSRHLAEDLGAGTPLAFERPGPAARAFLSRPPSPQSQPRLGGESRWKLVSQLTLNHLSLTEGTHSLDALKEFLTLHNLREDLGARRQIEGLIGIDCRRVAAHVGNDAWRGWRNGLEVRLRCNPQHFAGASAVLFSAVLAQFFSRYATANRFVRTVLLSPETPDKEIKTWQPEAGMPLSL